MDVKNRFVKYVAENGHITVLHVEHENNEADGFTKPLDVEKFEKLRELVCVCLLD